MILFRLPFGKNFYTTDQNKEISQVSFTSFDGDTVLKIPGNLTEILPENFQKLSFNLIEKQTSVPDETQEEYLKKIQKTIQIIRENQLPKIVIARKKNIPANIDIISTFRNLCSSYPSAFVYVFEENGICWIGAFSELLGKFDKKNQVFETMSLAGTLPLHENWTEKELEEQKTVTQYIAGILKKYSAEVQQSETYDHISGNIKHLRTDFKISVPEKNVKQLISELHPTPAVCGIPKDFCREKILELEHFPREFYAGYSSLETNTELYCYVNLRCGKVWQNSTDLFAGGGITALSDPKKEWRETELKMQALGKNMAIF